MTIGNHGSGKNVPTWKKIVICFVALLIFTPIIYKVVTSIPTASSNDQVVASATKTVDR
jgi:hypothetical protein